MTLHRIHMTQQPVGECFDCGLDGGHIVGCSTNQVAQNVSRPYVPTGAEFDAAEIAVPAAVLDTDAPAITTRHRVYDLAQELGQSAMDMREIIAHLTGVVPASSTATVSQDVADLAREFLTTHTDA